MRYDILCILLSMFVSIANSSPTTENECKRNAKGAEAIAKRLAFARYAEDLSRFVSCQDAELQFKPIKTYLNYIIDAKMANFYALFRLLWETAENLTDTGGFILTGFLLYHNTLETQKNCLPLGS